MNRRVALACGLLVAVAVVAGGTAGAGSESVGGLVADARDATESARAMVALAGRPWATRGVGAGVGVALGLVVGGTAAFAFYRGSV